ncbi:MAG: DUF2163 domain-containing protein [Salaquimonas sp.]
MRTISNEFQAHLDSECITLSNCWQIVLTNGSSLGFTDHDLDIEFDDVVFEAGSGFEASQVEMQNNLTPDNHEILGALQSDRITDEDIATRVYDNASIRHYVVNWSQPEQRVLMGTYLLGEISLSDGVFKAELKSLSAKLDQTKMRRFDRRCSAKLGDANCRIDVEGSFRVQAVVSKVLNKDQLIVTGLDGFQDDWFSGGKLTFQSGTNQGKSIEIVASTKRGPSTNEVLLSMWSGAYHSVGIGDEITVRPGCDKTLKTCQSKFANTINFRGFPHLPGTDFAMSYANNSDQMDGGPLVP